MYLFLIQIYTYNDCFNPYLSIFKYPVLDFSKNEPPVSCGYDDTTGEDRFCCADTGRKSSRVTKPQPPLFPKVRLLYKKLFLGLISYCRISYRIESVKDDLFKLDVQDWEDL